MSFLRARAIRKELDVHVSDEVIRALDRDIETLIKDAQSETIIRDRKRLTLPIYLGCKTREGFK